jgi:hypothetical protein
MSFGVVLTKIPCCSLKDQCQEAYCRDPEGPRPLEGLLRIDGAGDRVGARLAQSEGATNRTTSPVAWSNRQMSARLGLASAVREGDRRVCERPCVKHGACTLSPDRLHMLHEGLPQGSRHIGSGRVAGPVIRASCDDNQGYKPVRNTNVTVTRNADDVCSWVFKPTTWDCDLDQPILGRVIFKQGAAGTYGHDQPDAYGSSSISGGSAITVDRWLPVAIEQTIV